MDLNKFIFAKLINPSYFWNISKPKIPSKPTQYSSFTTWRRQCSLFNSIITAPFLNSATFEKPTILTITPVFAKTDARSADSLISEISAPVSIKKFEPFSTNSVLWNLMTGGIFLIFAYLTLAERNSILTGNTKLNGFV